MHAKPAIVINLRQARADDTAKETKNMSHNTLNYRDFIMKTDLKSRLPPYSNQNTNCSLEIY